MRRDKGVVEGSVLGTHLFLYFWALKRLSGIAWGPGRFPGSLGEGTSPTHETQKDGSPGASALSLIFDGAFN